MKNSVHTFSRSSKSALCLLLLSTFFGCTRPSETTSVLSLSLPSLMGSQRWGSQAFDEIAHVSLNVTGDGISQPIIFNWDGDEGKIATGTAPVAPTTFNIEVPQGNNRLIQVLVVYKDKTAAGSMQFFYGDVNKNLNLPSEVVDIEVTSLGSSTQVVDGQVMGRYLNGTDSGPSGKVDILYTAPGKPSMIIDRDVIINGWFSFFMLSQVPFSYRLPDGTLLWNGPVELNSGVFAAQSSVLRVSVPMHQRNNSWSGAAQWVPENPQVFVYGWFGNPAALGGKVVCDTPTPSTLTKISTGSSSATLLSRTNAAPPANLFNGALSSFYVQGGVPFATAGSPCLDATTIAAAKFKSALTFNASLIDGNGKDNAAGFRGAFISTNQGNSLNISNSANGRTMTGTFLPGVAAFIDGYLVFKKQALDDPHTHFAPCGAIASGALGFTPAGNGTVSGDSVTIDLLITPEEASAGTLVAVCSTRGGQMSDLGFWVSPSYFMSMGPGPGPVAGNSPYLRFEFDGGGFLNSNPGATILTKDKCYQLTARLYQSGTPYPYPTAGGLNLSGLTASFGSFYTTGSCVTGMTTASIPMGSSTSSQLFFKATSLTSLSSIAVTFSDTSISYGTTQPIIVENGKLKLSFPQKIVQGACYPIPMEYIEAPGDSTFFSKISASIVSGFTMSPGSGGSFYTDGTCGTSTSTPAVISAGSTTVFYKASDATPKAISVSASGTPQADAITSNVIVGAGSAIIDKIEAIHVGALVPGQCNQITLRLINYDGAVVPATYPFSVSFSTNVPGSLYSDSGCTTSGGSVPFAVGDTMRTIGFVPSVANTTVSLALVSGANSTSANLNISNPSAGGMGVDPLYIYGDAPTLNGKKIVGSHEFTSPKLVHLNFTPGATLMCSPTISGFSTANCSGIVDGSQNYLWTEADALADQARYFQISMPGNPTFTRTYKFKPSELYGSEFKAIHCDQTLSASDTFINVNSTYSASIHVICLGPGVVLTKTVGAHQIILNGNGGKALIGHTTGNTLDVAGLSAGGSPNVMINGDISTRVPIVANLNFISLAAGDTFLALGGGLVATAPSSQIRISGNSFNFAGNTSMQTHGIKSSAINDPDIDLLITGNQFTISSPQNPGGMTYGIALVDANTGSTMIKNNSLSGVGAAENCQITGVKVESVATAITGSMTIENLKWLGNGCGIVAAGAGGSYTIGSLTIKNSDIELASLTSPSLSALGIKLFNVVSFNLTNNRVAWTDPSATSSIDTLVKMDLSGGITMTGTFSNNVLSVIKNPSNQMLYLAPTGTPSQLTLNNFDFNQFVYQDSVNPAAAINSPVGVNINRTSPQANGNNLFCSSTANLWTDIVLAANATGGNFNQTDASTNCKHANDVNATSKLCQTRCGP